MPRLMQSLTVKYYDDPKTISNLVSQFWRSILANTHFTRALFRGDATETLKISADMTRVSVSPRMPKQTSASAPQHPTNSSCTHLFQTQAEEQNRNIRPVTSPILH